MDATSVTSKGQVTLPKKLRQRLGIRQGRRVEISVVGNDGVMRVRCSPGSQGQQDRRARAGVGQFEMGLIRLNPREGSR